MDPENQSQPSYRFTDARISTEMREMIFELESEEAAIAALTPPKRGWSRRGHRIVFTLPPEKETPDESIRGGSD